MCWNAVITLISILMSKGNCNAQALDNIYKECSNILEEYFCYAIDNKFIKKIFNYVI